MSNAKTLSDFKLTLAESKTPLWQRFEAHMQAELAYLRQKNDDHADIKDTTLRRGEIALVKRILALTPEVGPESRASEAGGPESQSVGFIAGIPVEQ